MKKIEKKKEVNISLFYNKNITINTILFNTEIQVQVDKRITLVQLKEELVPLIGVPPTGFIVYEIIVNKEIEMEGLYDTLEYIDSGSEV